MNPLESALRRIDGRSYPAYRDLEGRWDLAGYTVFLDRAASDPFAAPSRLRVVVDNPLDPALWTDRRARIATADWLLRRVVHAELGSRRGSGRSGHIELYEPGPEVCERSAVLLAADRIELRLRAGLPAQGRRVLGRAAYELFTRDLARAAALLSDGPGLQAHVDSVLDQQALREALDEHNLVAFIADGALLPRRSGVDQRPLPDAIPWESPPELAVTLDTPRGPVRGTGLPAGLTLLVGGGFHGKSTVLQALGRGHLDHVPGDGRERVVARHDAVSLRAEDGRSVRGVDISPFINDLPGGRSTRPFSTDDASGSTSQAAALCEALESGSRLLLLDEDTSASNLLVRDALMQQLIPGDQEPITPLIQRVGDLRDAGVSLVLVCGGVGDYLAVADTVLQLRDYRPQDVTARAHALAGTGPAAAASPVGPLARHPLPARIERIKGRDERRILLDREPLELGAIEQVLDPAHARTLALALRFVLAELANGERSVPVLLDALDAILADEGLDALSERPDGGLVWPRRHEVAAALSRWRPLRVQ